MSSGLKFFLSPNHVTQTSSTSSPSNQTKPDNHSKFLELSMLTKHRDRPPARPVFLFLLNPSSAAPFRTFHTHILALAGRPVSTARRRSFAREVHVQTNAQSKQTDAVQGSHIPAPVYVCVGFIHEFQEVPRLRTFKFSSSLFTRGNSVPDTSLGPTSLRE